MKFCLIPLLIVAFLTSLQGRTFEVELWPEEGRPVFESTAHQRLLLRVEPFAAASAADTVQLTAGERITFDQTRYRTVRPGRVQTLRAARVDGRSLGRVERISREEYYAGTYLAIEVEFSQGEHFEYLQYRAEGTCFVRIAGEVIDAAPCPTVAPESFRVEEEPTTEWWIRVVRNGKPVGWTRADAGGIRLVRREF